jgi:hypothetical protein
MRLHRAILFVFLLPVLVFPILFPSFGAGFANATSVERSPTSVAGLVASKAPARSSVGVPLSAPSPITNYTIVGVLNITGHLVGAQTTIKYVNHANVSLDKLVFHLYPNAFAASGGSTDMDSVRYAGNNLSYTVSGIDNTILTVDLVTAPGPGLLEFEKNVTLVLDYEVHIPNINDRFGWFLSPSAPQMLTYNMGNWHPIVAVYDDRGWHTAPYWDYGESFYSDVATYDVQLTVPSSYEVAATGELQGITAGPGTRTWSWLTGPVRDFTWCASPNYATSSILVNSVNVTSYYAAAHATGGQRNLQVAAHCLSIYGSLFGPYAWKSLRIVEIDFGAWGMEYPQLVMIDKSLFGDASAMSNLELTTAHEIGHEWIPFSIGTDSYAEPWIDEGFASFTEYCFAEYVYGNTARQAVRNYDLDSYWGFTAWYGDKCINQSVAYWESHPPEYYGVIVYSKAALVYDMLRSELGNATFYEAWHYVYQQALHRNIRAHDLQRLFEEAVGQSLDWFFNQWVFGSGVVTINIGGATAYQDATGWTVTFQVYQVQNPPIALRVPIHAVTVTGTEVTWVSMNPAPVTLCQISVTALPSRLIIDPDRLLLCRYSLATAYVGLSPNSPLFQQIVIVAVLAVVGVLTYLWYRRRRVKHSRPEASSAYQAGAS